MTAGKAPRSGGLGNIVKFASGDETKRGDGQIVDDDILATGRRLARWDLQHIAKELLPDKKGLMQCSWTPISNGVQMRKHPGTTATHYGKGIAHCGLAHLCPICSAKITERKRIELSKGIENWRQRGFTVVMATFTLQHLAVDFLILVLDKLLGAMRDLKSGRAYQRIADLLGIRGNVKSFDITVGKGNGWHPHYHVLFFVEMAEQEIDVKQIKDELYKIYSAKLDKLGGHADYEHGVDVRIGDDAVGNYLAKMGMEVKPKRGIDYEMTKGLQKVGKDGHYTPFDLLQIYKDGGSKNHKSDFALWAKDKFLEYAQATKGLQLIRWSPGLRDELKLGKEYTDKEIAQGVADTIEWEDYYKFSNGVWIKLRVLWKQVTVLDRDKLGYHTETIAQDMRGQFLEMARNIDVETFSNVIQSMLDRIREEQKQALEYANLTPGGP